MDIHYSCGVSSHGESVVHNISPGEMGSVLFYLLKVVEPMPALDLSLPPSLYNPLSDMVLREIVKLVKA